MQKKPFDFHEHLLHKFFFYKIIVLILTDVTILTANVYTEICSHRVDVFNVSRHGGSRQVHASLDNGFAIVTSGMFTRLHIR